MKFISRFIGFILILFGSLLMNINEYGETSTNIALKISGIFILTIGFLYLFPNTSFIKRKKDQDGD
ncbi:hypothetical protein FH508_0012260 [Lysinibacillus sp. CD3-6]|uniref:hypothetical protein n=1 Tax=Lysinibacillus sp. CD3-6 TaxID=2892541 RepID=UPI0011700BFB|nr:hypothetical protein [Lysinibacillus sp. CD3-6]UED78243.1 hypothetical protein FH508_0012260 [Lysinibacillus sp. CD3-6]